MNLLTRSCGLTYTSDDYKDACWDMAEAPGDAPDQQAAQGPRANPLVRPNGPQHASTADADDGLGENRIGAQPFRHVVVGTTKGVEGVRNHLF